MVSIATFTTSRFLVEGDYLLLTVTVLSWAFMVTVATVAFVLQQAQTMQVQ